MKPLFIILPVFLSFIYSCQQFDSKSDQAPQAPLFDYLGDYSLDITSSSAMAKRFFTQGMILAYAFNHEEAIRSLKEATRLDPDCAMCHWGLAYALGPNINAPMDTGAITPAYEAIQKAVRLSESGTEWEKAMINALSTRYIDSLIEDRYPLDSAYMTAMRGVHEQFPEKEESAAFFADAIMNLHPWNYWKSDKSPQPWTPELLNIIENLLQINPKNIVGTHLYIHAVEASDHPEKALAAADTLLNLVPGAGHLVHMPSHTYIRTGHYHKGTLVNQQASLADSLYITHCNIQGYYPLTYYPHNIHFIAACATLEGRSELAIDAAYKTAHHADHELIKDLAWGAVQHFSTIPFYVLTKFGKWDEILELPSPYDELKYPVSIWHYSRGMAFCGKGDLESAVNELKKLETLSADSSLQKVLIWGNNPSSDLVNIALKVLQAQISWDNENIDSAIILLTDAVVLEDLLIYQEPPDWFFSVRHSLGTALLQAGEFSQAEALYHEDLKNYPDNGWALHGLVESLEGQGKAVDEWQSRFNESWTYSDINLSGSTIKRSQ